MTALIRAVVWLPETLRLWDRRVRERQAQSNQTVENAATADLYHELNTSLWYILPPC